MPHVKHVRSSPLFLFRLTLVNRAKVSSATDRTKILSAGERSEQAVSGYLLQKGYWNDPIRTARVRTKNENRKLGRHKLDCTGWTGDEAELGVSG
ncbi:unnamed protein product [Tuber aestivum]|uniref:Uncharacterized protein n=1 Tax=Tuber aestivum TaxID=59557 RepID=A0A292PLX6_9PEZI|nr:unnamed protein product [Tuber aestivum]